MAGVDDAEGGSTVVARSLAESCNLGQLGCGKKRTIEM